MKTKNKLAIDIKRYSSLFFVLERKTPANKAMEKTKRG